MPLANGFLEQEQFGREIFYELAAGFCEKCGMVQLMDQPDREQMFNEQYPFFSGTSHFMTLHFKELADHVIASYLHLHDPFVVEIGSNDGIMLQNFSKAGIRHLGIEPSKNVAEAALAKGVNTISDFFDAGLARNIVSENGPADVFLAANVMCHIPYFHSIIEGIKVLLKPTGVVIFEDPYLGDVMNKISYDQIYDEHVFLFSLRSISYAFEQHGFELIDVVPQETHGGSMRYILAQKGMRPVSPAVAAQNQREELLGLARLETYERFRRNCEHSRESLRALLCSLKKTGKRIAGYGATSKSTTVINYCGITTDLIDYISDTTPIKQGKFSPGAHIPIKPYQKFQDDYPDYALLFAWNHSKEIMAKEQAYKKAHGKWIVYVPDVGIIE